MLILLLLFFILLVLLVGNHKHQKAVRAVRRTNRLLRRIPCVACGHPLLPAARVCPNCRSLQPLRGWAAVRERIGGSQLVSVINAPQTSMAVWLGLGVLVVGFVWLVAFIADNTR
jgi:hypothetical protein